MTEQELFDAILVKVPDLKHTEDKYDRIDCYTERSVIELKCRGVEYSTQLIEKDKYEALIADGRTPFYLVHTSKRVLFFRLDLIGEPEWEDKWLPATTEFGGGYKWKRVGFLPNSIGKEMIL